MTIALIPMAGESKRFSDSGYSKPKWVLPLKDGRPMLRAVLDSVGQTDTLITVSKKSHSDDVVSIVDEFIDKDKCIYLPVWVNEKTTGPMNSILRAKKYINTDEELILSYSDCFSANGLGEFLETLRASNCDAGVFCFRSDDMRFQRDPTGDYALGGIYWFRHANDFLKRAREFQPHPNLSPAHVAFTYRWGQLARWNLYVDTANYVDLGTPEDYEKYIGKRTVNKGDTITLPRFDTFEAFMADDSLGKWRKDRIGWLLYRSVTKQTLTEAENREIAADMQNQTGEGG